MFLICNICNFNQPLFFHRSFSCRASTVSNQNHNSWHKDEVLCNVVAIECNEVEFNDFGSVSNGKIGKNDSVKSCESIQTWVKSQKFVQEPCSNRCSVENPSIKPESSRPTIFCHAIDCIIHNINISS